MEQEYWKNTVSFKNCRNASKNKWSKHLILQALSDRAMKWKKISQRKRVSLSTFKNSKNKKTSNIVISKEQS